MLSFNQLSSDQFLDSLNKIVLNSAKNDMVIESKNSTTQYSCERKFEFFPSTVSQNNNVEKSLESDKVEHPIHSDKNLNSIEATENTQNVLSSGENDVKIDYDDTNDNELNQTSIVSDIKKSNEFL